MNRFSTSCTRAPYPYLLGCLNCACARVVRWNASCSLASVLPTFAEETEPVEDKRYFILKRGRQAGPYTKGELHAKGLLAHTPVWDEDHYNWSVAEKFDDLKELLQVPPAANKGRGWLSFGRRRRS